MVECRFTYHGTLSTRDAWYQIFDTKDFVRSTWYHLLSFVRAKFVVVAAYTNIYIHTYIYVYIYIYKANDRVWCYLRWAVGPRCLAALGWLPWPGLPCRQMLAAPSWESVARWLCEVGRASSNHRIIH